MTTATTTLPAFVAARLDEWEAAASAAGVFPGGDSVMAALPTQIFDGLRPGFPARVLATVTALRAVVALHNPCDDWSYGDAWTCPELCAVAAIWVDHQDYRTEWSA